MDEHTHGGADAPDCVTCVPTEHDEIMARARAAVMEVVEDYALAAGLHYGGQINYEAEEARYRADEAASKSVVEAALTVHEQAVRIAGQAAMPCYDQKVQAYPFPHGPVMRTTCSTRGGVRCASCMARDGIPYETPEGESTNDQAGS